MGNIVEDLRHGIERMRERQRFWLLPRTRRRLEAARRLGADISVSFWFSEQNHHWVGLRFVLLSFTSVLAWAYVGTIAAFIVGLDIHPAVIIGVVTGLIVLLILVFTWVRYHRFH